MLQGRLGTGARLRDVWERADQLAGSFAEGLLAGGVRTRGQTLTFTAQLARVDAEWAKASGVPESETDKRGRTEGSVLI